MAEYLRFSVDVFCISFFCLSLGFSQIRKKAMSMYFEVVVVLIAVVAFTLFYLRIREKNRKALFYVLLNLTNEELETALPKKSVDAVQHRYEKLKGTVNKLHRLAHQNYEFALCKKLEKDLGSWRVQKIQEIYEQRLSTLLRQIHNETNSSRRLSLLYQARDLIKEGVLDDEILKKIDKWLVYTHIKQVRNKEQGLSSEMKYQLYEKAITEILNSGIEDAELEAIKEFKEFITDFEIMYKRLKKSESKND